MNNTKPLANAPTNITSSESDFTSLVTENKKAVSVKYCVIKEVYSLHNDTSTYYGIAAYSNYRCNGSAVILKSFHCITQNKRKICSLVNRCNKLKLAYIHLADVVDDFLAE